MSRVDWQRLNTAFEQGAALPGPALADYLLALAEQDAAVAEEVARLLAAASTADHALLQPVIAAAADLWVRRRADEQSNAVSGDEHTNDGP